MHARLTPCLCFPPPHTQGYEELAGEAAESLKRLVSELGDPEAGDGEGQGAGGGGEEEEEEGDGEGEGRGGKGAGRGAERLGCGAATPLDNPAVYADCLQVETVLRKLRAEARIAPRSPPLSSPPGAAAVCRRAP